MEKWKDVAGYEGLYQVSDLGNVRSVDRTVVCKDGRKQFWKGMMLKPAKNIESGYLYVNLHKNNIGKPTHVAILVAKAFSEYCGEWFEGAQVDHINTDRTDNRAVNLRVCTRKENCNNPLTKQKMSEAHKGKFGADCQNSKPVLQYSKDGRLIKRWDCTADVERVLGIANQNISKCCLGKRKSAGGYVWKFQKQ